MKTINHSTARKELNSKHTTMAWSSDFGRVSIRKTAGKYVVKLEDFDTGRITISPFATLPGATICADNLRNFYL